MTMPNRMSIIRYIIAAGSVLTLIQGVQCQCPENSDVPVVNMCDYISLSFTDQLFMRVMEADLLSDACLANCTITNDQAAPRPLAIRIKNKAKNKKCVSEIKVSAQDNFATLSCTSSNYIYLTVRQNIPVSLELIERGQSICIKLRKADPTANTEQVNIECGVPPPPTLYPITTSSNAPITSPLYPITTPSSAPVTSPLYPITAPSSAPVSSTESREPTDTIESTTSIEDPISPQSSETETIDTTLNTDDVTNVSGETITTDQLNTDYTLSTDSQETPSESILSENPDEFPVALVAGVVSGIFIIIICGIVIGALMWRKRKREKKPHYLLNNSFAASMVNRVGAPHLHRNPINHKSHSGTLQLVLSFPSDKPFSEANIETSTKVIANEQESLPDPQNDITLVKTAEMNDDIEKIPFPPDYSDGYLHDYDASVFAPSIKLRYPSLNLRDIKKGKESQNYRSPYPGYLPHTTAKLENNLENNPGFITIDSKDALYAIPLKKGERVILKKADSGSESNEDIDV